MAVPRNVALLPAFLWLPAYMGFTPHLMHTGTPSLPFLLFAALSLLL